LAHQQHWAATPAKWLLVLLTPDLKTSAQATLAKDSCTGFDLTSPQLSLASQNRFLGAMLKAPTAMNITTPDEILRDRFSGDIFHRVALL
jgi:hypothetical protein